MLLFLPSDTDNCGQLNCRLVNNGTNKAFVCLMCEKQRLKRRLPGFVRQVVETDLLFFLNLAADLMDLSLFNPKN